MCCITLPLDTLFQGRFSSPLPSGSLPAFEIASQTFCLRLCQDASLSLTAITAQLQPAKTPSEAKSFGRSHHFSYLSISHRYSAANPFFVWHCGLGRSQRSRVGSRKVAEQPRVSQVDQLSQLTPRWSYHHHHFKFPAPFQPSRAPHYMWVSHYSYLLYKYTVKQAFIHWQQSCNHWQTFISNQ